MVGKKKYPPTGPWELGAYYEIGFDTFISNCFGADITPVKVRKGTVFLCQEVVDVWVEETAWGQKPGAKPHVRLVCVNPRDPSKERFLSMDVQITRQLRRLNGFRKISSPLTLLAMAADGLIP